MDGNWKRNLWATWIAELLALVGFSSITPILPYYIQYLGIQGDEVRTWTGLIYSAPFFTMGLLAPVWGALGDRYGRKLMVERAMFGGALITAAMGLAQTAWQLALLRMLQGAITGTVAAATTMVASATPREQLGETLGKLQVAIFLGQSLGPLFGGFVADGIGYRQVFVATGALLLAGGLVILTQVHERFTPVASAVKEPAWKQMRLLFASLLGVVLLLRFGLRLGVQMTAPMLPLLVQAIMPESTLLGSASGLLATISGLTSAVAAPLLGRLGDRYGGRRILLLCATGAATALLLQGLIPIYALLVVWQALLGLAVGGTLAVISAFVGRSAPEGREGTAYGLDAMAVSLSNAVAPLLGGWTARYLSLEATFLIGGGLMAVSGLGVLRLPRNGATRPPTVS